MSTATATPKPRETVSDDMVARGLTVLATAPLDMPYEGILQLARDVIEAALSDPRRCGTCGGSLWNVRADAKWCSAACRMAAYRARRASPIRNQQRSRSGAQVSFWRAVDVLAKSAPLVNTGCTRGDAERILREALPDRQRARLEARRR